MQAFLPKSEPELLQRAISLMGYTLYDLAQQLEIPFPEDWKRAKGWVGQALEVYLGAQSGNQALPDFLELGIELKTLPLNVHHLPQETTYVSIVPPLQELTGLTWQTSAVRQKLSRVLWLPYEANPGIPHKERRIGRAILWSPSKQQEAQLQQDFEEIMDEIVLRGLHSLNATLGTYLHIRPKAANNKARCLGLDAEGRRFDTVPRGFYLRTSLTKKILNLY